MPDEAKQPYSGPERRQAERREFDPLDGSIVRLAKFRETWESGDQIDQFSQLTAEDLDRILAALNWPDGQAGVTRLRGE